MQIKTKKQCVDALKYLLLMADKVWYCYLQWGPVDDGTKEGKAFSDALDKLMETVVEIRGADTQ